MAALVWDNCGPHGTAAVREMADEWGITLLPLPKNMTDVLQVMDLVVNSPVKAALRRDRERLLFHQFQAFKVARLKAKLEKKPLPEFNPPKPKVHEGIRSLLSINSTTFADPRFKRAMSKCFIDVSIAPDEESNETEMHFKEYKAHKHGSLAPNGHFKQYHSDHLLGSLGMAIDSLDGALVETRNDAMNADLSDEDGDESDEEEGEEEEDF